MNAAEAADAELEVHPFWEVVDVAKRDLVDGECLAFTRVAGWEEFIFVHPFGAAEDCVRVAEVDEGFEQETVESISRVVVIATPGKGGLPVIAVFVPCVVVRDGGGEAFDVDIRL